MFIAIRKQKANLYLWSSSLRFASSTTVTPKPVGIPSYDTNPPAYSECVPYDQIHASQKIVRSWLKKQIKQHPTQDIII